MWQMLSIPSIRLVAACLLVVMLVGCEETVNPIVGEERPFTIWGFMDASADTQKVRVFTIEERLGLDRAGPIDARVTSWDLDTGERREWNHREVVYDDGAVGHVFWSAFRAQHEHSYRLEIERSDGNTTSAEVTVPTAGVTVEIDTESNRSVIPAKVIGTPPRLIKLEVEYDAVTVTPANPWPPGSARPASIRYPVSIPYDTRAEKFRDGWEMEIDMPLDFTIVQEEFATNCLPKDLISLRRMDFRFLVANEDWDPPGGEFDPDVLAEPGVFSNVENGFGFFGAGYSISTRWSPPQSVMETVGYTFSAPCAMGPQDIPACQLPPEPCFREQN